MLGLLVAPRMNSNEWDLAGPWPQYAAPNEAEHQSHVESGRSFANPNGLPSLITMLAQASNLAVALAAKHQQKTFRMHKGTFLRKRAEWQGPLAFELTQTQRTLVNEPLQHDANFNVVLFRLSKRYHGLAQTQTSKNVKHATPSVGGHAREMSNSIVTNGCGRGFVYCTLTRR